jgi:HEAT repeat protein
VRQTCLGYLDHLDFLPDEDFIDTVVAAMNDRVPKVRRMAIHTLCCDRCKSVPAALKPEHVEVMVRLAVSDENARVRAAAAGMVETLAKSRGCSSAAERLKVYAREGASDVRPRAEELLAKLSA